MSRADERARFLPPLPARVHGVRRILQEQIESARACRDAAADERERAMFSGKMHAYAEAERLLARLDARRPFKRHFWNGGSK